MQPWPGAALAFQLCSRRMNVLHERNREGAGKHIAVCARPPDFRWRLYSGFVLSH
jgi:hypothetical protein